MFSGLSCNSPDPPVILPSVCVMFLLVVVVLCLVPHWSICVTHIVWYL